MGLDDIRAVSFECKKCQVRLTLAPDKINLEAIDACPGCSVLWCSTSVSSGRIYTTVMARFLDLFPSLLQAQKPDSDASANVRILLEFDEPR